ncbi:hypothetical protein [Psychrobacter sp. DAB_AL62B]|uniref:hypothetical protein n=1 Tax=Psychrobacter sp. DAB_AL62B TaxID=1028420 RepID=UPI00238113C6|nr:hypothetical protein [Psychrobacter sp. DAB_AL62B]MDE4454342.1 hypothetical protein [Psychrobacter sp. DAB_AL62B]
MIPQTVIDSNNLTASDYSAGACDLSVEQSNGRYGVSGALIGKYVPIAADMPVNVYMDKTGNPVRLSMQQYDNHFGAKFSASIMSDVKEAEALDAQVAIAGARSLEPVVVETTDVIRPAKYRVKEVMIPPEDQIKYINTADGTIIAIEKGNDLIQ